MHLKKLIISGFKSFADRVTLNFDKGITGIVGPNGSGKSNVIDAVRWVMGEQNAKHLRGKVATDIIFAGSDKRKPLGMAEVTLVFDNTEADDFSPPEYRHDAEISLTRRLYIDGQREYFINKKVCRLKDIVNFFAVTGLGGRSYSMIQQGQVDRILNARPEDVREILEEAAGTLVYRRRKDEANKRLAETNENLSRVDDILEELSTQLDGLKEQVTKATKYKELSTDLRNQEISLFCHNFKHFTSKLLLLNETLETGSEQEVGQIKELTDLEVRHSKLQQQLAEADPGLDALREQLAIIREQIVRTETVIASSDTTIENYQERIDAIAADLSKESDSHGDIGEKLAGITAKLDELEASLAGGQDLLEQLEFDSSQVDEKAQVFINRMDELEDSLRNTDRLMENNGVRCENIERERQRYLKEIALIDQKREELEGQASEAKKQLDIEEEALAGRKTGVDGDITAKADFEDRLAAIQAEAEELQRQRDSVNKSLYSDRAKQETLEELGGEGEASQQVLDHLRGQPDTADLPVLALTDHLAFKPEATLPSGVKTLLDSWSNRLVVPAAQQFTALVAACAQQPLPETYVEVLSEVRQGNQSAWQAFAQQHNLQPLSAYVTVSAPADAAFSGLEDVLTPVYYDPNNYLTGASLPAGMAVIDSSGFLRHSHSRVIGGSKGRLSRKEELAALAEAISLNTDKIEGIEERLAELDEERSVINGQLSTINQKLSESNQDVIERMAEIQKWTQTHSHVASLIDQSKVDQARIDVAYNKLVDELKQLSTNRLALGNEKTTLQEELDQLKDESSEITEEREEIKRQLDAKKLELAAVEAQVAAVTDNRDNLESQLAERDNTLKAKQLEQESLGEKLATARREQQEATDSIAEFIYNREQLEEELNTKREQNAGIIGELKEVEQQLKAKRDEHSKFQQDRTQKSMEIEQLKAVSKGILEQAMEDYQIDLMNYPFEEDPNFNEKAAHAEVKSLKRKIDNLGAVNMMAVEEYDKLTERFTMVTGQKDEVLGSMEILANAVAEIELSAKDKFLQTFEQINQYFTELFPILFPGGEARLECQDLENPLESGVEIMVRMPGKTAKSMTLYSGGEKALTAISLIFALLKTKPTPFCFLDEVDAPLDEANVSKYNNVLDVLSKRFQFVVITHNRKTMEVLDQLYGVTMQEAGVSKVVGVDLNRDLPTHLQKSFAEDRDRIIQGAATS